MMKRWYLSPPIGITNGWGWELSAMVRDHEGKVIACRSKTKMDLLDPTAAEALAAFLGVQLCKDLGLTHIMLEGDAKLVVEAVKALTRNWRAGFVR